MKYITTTDMETNLIPMIMRGNNVKHALERLRMNEDEMTELWYEMGLALIRRVKKGIQNKTAFDHQFGELRGNVKFDSLTAEELFAKIETSHHFWNWWLNCLVSMCTQVNRATGGRVDRNRSYLIAMFSNYSHIPLFVLHKIFEIDETKKRFRIRGIAETEGQKRPAVQPIV